PGPAELPAEAAAVAAEPTPLAEAAAAATGVAPEPGVHFKPGHPHHEEAIDLGSTVLPVLAKAYGKQVALGLLTLLVLRWLVRRRRRA
ncbi:MAG TPA: hypothetical protein PLP61_16720, partial [Nocardioides sp.]|nr:hypothetical protein [Nocardioides sp.]